MLDSDRQQIRSGLRESLGSPRAAFLIGLSVLVLGLLFFSSWLLFVPVAVLVVAPLTLAFSFAAGVPPSAPLNSIAAIGISGVLAAASVLAALRVLLARVRARSQPAPNDRADALKKSR